MGETVSVSVSEGETRFDMERVDEIGSRSESFLTLTCIQNHRMENLS